VGSPSEQPDGGDRLKAAFSDALKRAAVKFGVGRYLYRLPAQWVDYDAQKRRFARTPEMPRESTPAGNANRGRKNPMNGQVPERTITVEERQALTELLTRKNKTVKAAMKSLGSNAMELADLSCEQYLLLIEKLKKLPDIRPT
jgi:hypothetical protein